MIFNSVLLDSTNIHAANVSGVIADTVKTLGAGPTAAGASERVKWKLDHRACG